MDLRLNKIAAAVSQMVKAEEVRAAIAKYSARKGLHMHGRKNVDGYEAVNANVKRPVVIDPNLSPSGVGQVPGAVAGTVTALENGDDNVHVTVLTLTDMPQTVVNGTEYQGTEIYDFPLGRILILGVTASLAQKTTSAIASTLNSGVTGSLGLGTATASSTTLSTTMQDLIPATAFTTSTTINVAAAAVLAALAASAQFDGRATAKKAFLNTAYATTTDVDADATQTITGTITITWINLGA